MNRPTALWSAIVTAAATLACGGSTEQELVTPSVDGRCQMSLATPALLPATPTQLTASLSAARECSWAARSEAAWLQLEPASGQGAATLTLTVTENPQGRNRTATIVINDQQFIVTQDAAPCNFAVAPPSLAVAHQGGRVLLQVSTLDGCSWTAQSSHSWLRVIAGNAGDGSATLELAIDSNAGQERSALLTVATLVVAVTQEAGPDDRTECRFSLHPGSRAIPAVGGSGSFTLSTLPGCAWSVTSNQPWIVIVSNMHVIGSSTVVYRVDPNPSTSVRSGAIGAGTRQHVVRQEAAARP